MVKYCVAIFAALMFLSPLQTFAAPEKAEAFAIKLADDAVAILQDGDLSESGKQNKLEALFAKNVDLNWVARFVLGKHWRSATKAQQQDYTAHYKTFVIRNFTRQLADYAGQSYRVKQVIPEGEKGEFLLTLEIISKGEPSIYLDYRLRQKGSRFQIFDIIIEGVSLITTQRSEFGAVVDREGLDYLISALAARAGD